MKLKWNPWFLFWMQTIKWEEYLNWQRKLKEAKASAAALRASISEMSSERKPLSSKWRSFFRRSPLEEVKVVKNNVYDKGFINNVQEVISPFSTRASFRQSKWKSGWDCSWYISFQTIIYCKPWVACCSKLLLGGTSLQLFRWPKEPLCKIRAIIVTLICLQYKF